MNRSTVRKNKSVRRKSKSNPRKSVLRKFVPRKSVPRKSVPRKSVRRKPKSIPRNSIRRKPKSNPRLHKVFDEKDGNKLNIAIIGEGPIGLCVATYLLYLVSKGLKAKITLYVKRAVFERNQLLQISTSIIEKLESIMDCSDDCFHKQKTITNVQVKCIEFILYSKLKLSINIKSQWSEHENMTKYNHIFCADGYHSPSRHHFFGKIKQLVTRFSFPVFMIFSDISDCDHLPKSLIFKLKDLDREIGTGDYEASNNMSSLISFAYNFHKYSNSFPNKPFRQEVDHWASGFSDLEEYMSVFENAIKYIKKNKNNMEPIYKILVSKEAEVSVNMILLCKNTQKLDETLINLINFLGPKINKNEKFLAHFVKPASCPQGIQLHKDKLQYCKKHNNSNIWLIGDSCNAYPPGHSTELGIIDVFNLLNIIFKGTSMEKHCIYLPQERYSHNLLSCNVLGQISWNHCPIMDEFTFVNGYPEGDYRNIKRNFKKLKIELEKYISRVYTISKNAIDEYNIYQFKNYFNNLFNLVCDDKHSLMS
jgi:hypothetical protein